MKFLSVLFTFSSFAYTSFSQSPKNYLIDGTSCSVYMICNPGKFESSYEKDSSKIYSRECIDHQTTYGIFLIDLPATLELSAAEEKTIFYLDFLKEKKEIGAALGYSKGHRLNKNENTRGVIDQWIGPGGIVWKLRAWTDGKYIAILYVHGRIVIEESKKDAFLNGFRFSQK